LNIMPILKRQSKKWGNMSDGEKRAIQIFTREPKWFVWRERLSEECKEGTYAKRPKKRHHQHQPYSGPNIASSGRTI